MAGRQPDVCVVIATRGREEGLARALDALAAQGLEQERLEVVVVRDGDPPGPVAAAPEGLTVRFEAVEPPRGPAAARNVGWRASGAPLIAFTDDDCRPAPGWLDALLRSADGGSVFLQGRTEPDPRELDRLSGLSRSQLIEGPTGWYQTCNMAYPRELLERLGGFDESFPGPAGEDTDLGLRALEEGARAQFVEEAVVWHAVHPRSLTRALRESGRWSAVARLLARHPGQRERIYRRLFFKESHAKLVLGLAGTLLGRRRIVALAAWAPYVELHLRTYDRTPRGFARAAFDLPQRALIDAAEVAATARGAARHRVPVL
jgi:GT2 family glycosyltransferase